jgi:hypothetical protein
VIAVVPVQDDDLRFPGRTARQALDVHLVLRQTNMSHIVSGGFRFKHEQVAMDYGHGSRKICNEL